MRKKYTPPQSQTIPLDVSGNMMYGIAFSKPGGKGKPGTIRIQKRPDTFSPFTQEEEEENEDRTDATLWEFLAWDKASLWSPQIINNRKQTNMNILLSLLVSSVYIFNAQGQYLCIGEDGTPMLSDAPVSLDVTRVDEVADAGRFDLDYTGMKWILKPSAEHTYTLGYQVGEANATTFVYVRSGAMATTFEEPDATFLDGQWAVSTGEESQPVFLDETADYVCPQFYKQHVDVTLQRSLVAQEWNTLCLPFPLHADQVSALWGEGTRVAEYTGDTGDKLLFTTCEDIEAGVPYVLKPERVSEDNVYRVEGIDISSWDRGNRSRETVADGTRFVGFYGPTMVPANAYVFGDGDRMYCLETDMKANGFRGYFQSNDPQAAVRDLGWTVEDQEVTSVPQTAPVVSRPADGAVFNTGGQLVRRKGSAEPLAPGLYIVNGIKIIVK